MLYDNHGREISYLRVAVTDRCNLRCQYCMPEEGIQYVGRSDLLTYEELYRIISVLASQGVKKIRITGGEPFLRKELMSFIEEVNRIEGITSIHVTTNGTLISDHIASFTKVGIKSVNLSLDSLDPLRFKTITRRDDLEKVMDSLHQLIEHDIKTKINMVVMKGANIDDILPMIELTKHLPISVRFLEEMPFNGSGMNDTIGVWSHHEILSYIQEHHPKVVPTGMEKGGTSSNYQIPGYEGSIGIIASYSRTFCGTCNRLRLTPTGLLKTCLYDQGIFNIRDLIRAGASDHELLTALKEAIGSRAKDGYEAEKRRSLNNISESMATIGG